MLSVSEHEGFQAPKEEFEKEGGERKPGMGVNCSSIFFLKVFVWLDGAKPPI